MVALIFEGEIFIFDLRKKLLSSKGTKASIALLFANVITSGISYLVTPIYTRILSSEVYGQVTLFQTWFQLFGVIAMFCLSYGVFNNGMLEYEDKRDEYSFSMLILSNIITFCFCGILFTIYPLISKWIGLEKNLFVLMIIVFLTQPAYNFWTSRQRYEMEYKWMMIWAIICAILSPLIAIISINNGTNKLYARILGAQIPLIIIYIGFYIYLFIKATGKLDIHYWREALFFNIPLIPHYLSTYVLSASDKIMISNIVGETQTAYYSVAYAIASIVIVVWGSVNASLVPYTYEKCKEEKYEDVSNITTSILIGFAIICLIIILIAPEIFYFMATRDYSEALDILPTIIGGVFFQIQYYIYANIIYYHKKTNYVLIASSISAVLNIVLNYFLIITFGYMAAGYTTLISYLVQAILDYYAMKKVVGIEVYNMKLIGVLSALIIFISIIGPLIYKKLIVRYALLVILGIILVLNKEKIVALIENN